ncbi:hypothetical protein FHW12_002119 [Dokdonella fugitiva]|uniref:Uncharacterized protein n=1 Tax=Dokdonella fugitiva TaxID=328517 RepID=A0A839EVW0_9GAMM|nr:hypothetical protein [Dokdonella fugitiva]MBA8887895.1 hypothetical protein [Dokdonella fugitiva]
MKGSSTAIPLRVLAHALGIAAIVGIPFLFVAVNQVRRACGEHLFGSRQDFCSASELARWLLALPALAQLGIVATIVAIAVLVRGLLRRLAA